MKMSDLFLCGVVVATLSFSGCGKIFKKKHHGNSGSEAHIVRGNPVGWEHDAPYGLRWIEQSAVSLGAQRGETWVVGCSGINLTKNVVLTAAHCLKSTTREVLVGEDLTGPLGQRSHYKGKIVKTVKMRGFVSERETPTRDLALVITEGLPWMDNDEQYFPVLPKSTNWRKDRVYMAGYGDAIADADDAKNPDAQAGILRTSHTENCVPNPAFNKYVANKEADNPIMMCKGFAATRPSDAGGPVYLEMVNTATRWDYKLAAIVMGSAQIGNGYQAQVFDLTKPWVRKELNEMSTRAGEQYAILDE